MKLVPCLLLLLTVVLAHAEVPHETCAATAKCAESCTGKQLDRCVAACASKAEPKVARPLFDALQACSKPNCASRCEDPASLGCRMCVVGYCSTEVGACMGH